MEFKHASDVSAICWDLRTADYTRGRNRALINQLFNGAPPYSEEEVEQNEINVNVNFLEATRLGHDARSQMSNAFQKPGLFFNVKTDAGPKHSREKYNQIATTEVNRIMKRSLPYFECKRSKHASLILHGIGPAVWENSDEWCPTPVGPEDLLIPSNTFLTFKGLPFFAFLKSFTAPQLIKMTRGNRVDKGWNIPLVEQALRYIDKESMALVGSNFPEIWSPEKVEERIKSDGTFYSGDSIPTLDCYDFYYWSDEKNNEGWRRRIVIDDWASSLPAGGRPTFSRNKDLAFASGQWLYDSGSRKFADQREQLFSCQFADLSAVAPFRYHSVRSLGFLMYGICHLQNRMRCKFQESVFEALTMLFRVKTMDDVQRALKIELVNKGFIDDSITPVPAADRWQVNANLVQLGLTSNKELIQENASSYTQNTNNSQGGVEKTRYQVMAEVNAMASLVSAGLTQAYHYETFEYIEIFRRFRKKNSTDAGALAFQAACLRQGIPEKVLYSDSWEVEPEQILGGGNLTRETAIAEWLMQHYEKYEPQSQRLILNKATFSVTGDPGLSNELVPDEPQISKSVHDTELTFASLMAGIQVQPSEGLNSAEVAGTTLRLMAQKIQEIKQSGNVGTPEILRGLITAANYANQFTQRLAQDKQQKAQVKMLSDALSKIGNEIKGFAQRQQQAAQKTQEQAAKSNGGIDPVTQSKIQGNILMAKTKSKIAADSHAKKTAQRQISFEMKLKQDAEKHKADLAAKDIEAATSIRRNRLTSNEE